MYCDPLAGPIPCGVCQHSTKQLAPVAFTTVGHMDRQSHCWYKQTTYTYYQDTDASSVVLCQPARQPVNL